MTTAASSAGADAAQRKPAWASSLGAVAIVLGVFLTGWHGNEWLKQVDLVRAMPASGEMPAADCPEEELREEGISLAECEYMVEHVRGIVLSTPDWFPGAFGTVAAVGALLAFVSIVVGGALVNYTPAAGAAAVGVFGGLALVDVLQFALAVNAGPILRDLYLPGILLWFLLHLMLAVGAAAGQRGEADAQGRA